LHALFHKDRFPKCRGFTIPTGNGAAGGNDDDAFTVVGFAKVLLKTQMCQNDEK
jgi:hypothetical protein